MKVGIGLPSHIPGASGELTLEWARKAETGPFSCLAATDRIVFPNCEPMVTLAAAAAVTQNIRLITTVLVAPLRNTGIFAKEAATVDALSCGRLTLGLGVGRLADDFWAAPTSYSTRGKDFEIQLDVMTRVWSGKSLDASEQIGPAPYRTNGPEIMIGGTHPRAVARAVRWGSGYIAGPSSAAQVRERFDLAEAAWDLAGREGRPYFVGLIYFALGPEVERGADFLRKYYSFNPAAVESAVNGLRITTQDLKDRLRGYEEIGMDECAVLPAIPTLDQLDRLADILG